MKKNIIFLLLLCFSLKPFDCKSPCLTRLCCAVLCHNYTLKNTTLESNANFQGSPFPPGIANWMIVSHELEHTVFGGKEKKKKSLVESIER
uniref:Secreted protein n=1 Tax=Bubo bubo TaxID=30461 RepID=A0A8C0EFP0_BUBBB